MTLSQFDRLFTDEESCKTYLFARRWPQGVRCPRCKNEHVYASKARPWHWQCKQCGKNNRSPYRFSLLTGTVFEETKVPLLVWFKVTLLMLTSKKGISALQIHRLVGFGSYKTAWYMCHRVRAALSDPEFQQLMGIVEIDETYIGGKNANRPLSKRFDMQGRGPVGKTAVIGAIARKGNVVCRVIEDASAQTANKFIREIVSKRVSLIATDTGGAYRRLDQLGMPHDVVDHKALEYVRGEVHTNNIESFWSLLKRGVIGTYHNISVKYLPLYLNEFSFRFNNRNEADIFGKAIAGC
jgi:transposase-like protein